MLMFHIVFSSLLIDSIHCQYVTEQRISFRFHRQNEDIKYETFHKLITNRCLMQFILSLFYRVPILKSYKLNSLNLTLSL